MYKVDSFIREVSRLKGFSARPFVLLTFMKCCIDRRSIVVLHRKVMNPSGFTFHDGVNIPYGTHISAASSIVNTNEETFEDPTVFDGFRFAHAQEELDDVNVKHQLTSPAMNNLFYGVGKHACPGR